MKIPNLGSLYDLRKLTTQGAIYGFEDWDDEAYDTDILCISEILKTLPRRSSPRMQAVFTIIIRGIPEERLKCISWITLLSSVLEEENIKSRFSTVEFQFRMWKNDKAEVNLLQTKLPQVLSQYHQFQKLQENGYLTFTYAYKS